MPVDRNSQNAKRATHLAHRLWLVVLSKRHMRTSRVRLLKDLVLSLAPHLAIVVLRWRGGCPMGSNGRRSLSEAPRTSRATLELGNCRGAVGRPIRSREARLSSEGRRRRYGKMATRVGHAAPRPGRLPSSPLTETHKTLRQLANRPSRRRAWKVKLKVGRVIRWRSSRACPWCCPRGAQRGPLALTQRSTLPGDGEVVEVLARFGNLSATAN